MGASWQLGNDSQGRAVLPILLDFAVPVSLRFRPGSPRGRRGFPLSLQFPPPNPAAAWPEAGVENGVRIQPDPALPLSRRISPDLLGRRRVRAHGEESSTRGIFPAGSLRVRPAAVRSWRGQTPTVNGLLLGLRRELSPQKREIGRATTLRHSGVYTPWDLI